MDGPLEPLDLRLCASRRVLAGGSASAQDLPAGEAWLFVLQGTVTAISDDEMNIAADPRIVAFTDRPDRDVRFIGLAGLASAWGEGAEFRRDPPNASEIDETNDTIGIIEITNLVDSGDSADLTFEVLEGDLPNVGEHIAPTIDLYFF